VDRFRDAATVDASFPSWIEAVKAEVEPLGARVEPLLDGAVIAVVSGSGAATDQAAAAARCALTFRRHVPGQPIALATGRGVVSARWPIGEVVDRGARLMAAIPAAERAGGGPVHIDEVTAGLLDGRFEVQAEGSFFRLIGMRDAESGVRTLLGRATPCVGREREIASLTAYFDECRDESRARPVLVTAPAGAGKSRLQSEVVKALQGTDDTVRVWTGRGDPMRSGSPLGLLAAMIGRAAGLRDGEPAEVRRQKLESAIAARVGGEDRVRVQIFIGEVLGLPYPVASSDLLRAARQSGIIMGEQVHRAWIDWLRAETLAGPVLMILEDIHWADEPSMKIIDGTLRDLAERPLLVLALARPEVHDRFPRLWEERNVQEIRLRELGKKAAETLVRKVLGDQIEAEAVERLVQRAAGNAFFLEELIRALADGRAEGLPDTVLAMAQMRLSRLPSESRRILRAASVFGEVFWQGAVTALTGSGDGVAAWLDELAQREVLTRRSEARFSGEREYAFRHALVRDAAYAMLTANDRTLGHKLAGDWLEAKGEGEALVLAEHFEIGGEPRRAAGAFLRAAAQSLQRNDFHAALALADRAVAQGVPEEAQGDLNLYRGRAFAALSKWGDARGALSAALEHTPEDRVERRAEILTVLSAACFWAQDLDAVRRHTPVVMALADQLGRGDLAASVMGWRGMVATSDGDVHEGLDWFRRSAERQGGQTVHALQPLLNYWLGRVDRGSEDAERVVAKAKGVNDVTTLMMAMPHFALNLVGSGRYAEADAVFAEARAIGRRYGITTLLSRVISMQAGWHVDVYDYAGAEAVALEACDLGRSIGYMPSLVSSMLDLLFIYIRRGELDRAEEHRREVGVVLVKAAGWHEWIWNLRDAVAGGEIALSRGRHEEALALVSAALQQDPRRVRVKYTVLGHGLRARALSALGREEEARADRAAALALARPVGDPALLLRAALYHLEGGRDEALARETRAVIDRMAAAMPDRERAVFLRADPLQPVLSEG
jgi:tetratricopeptide (TPR) repeat protein